MIPNGPRCLVVDLGSLDTREEQAIAAGHVLERLWRRRAAREPVVIVIDEAHNVCPRGAGGAGRGARHRGRHPDRGGGDASSGCTWSS
jgi:DNA helicase HerA-like ATPase